MNWLARMFTIPRAQRDRLNAIPVVHVLAYLVQGAAISTAQGVIDQHVSDPALAETIKAAIASAIQAHIPIPEPPASGDPQIAVAPFAGMPRPSLAPLNSPIIDPTAPVVPELDPLAAGAENAGA